ncbi:hypothetical protein K0U07_04415 [bacterium]|nr:hypothetical protein [bacterium]
MTYGIPEVQQAYDLWKDGDKNELVSFAVSFSSPSEGLPLIFVGISSIQKNWGKKVFSHKVIAYLHSLLKIDGAFFFPDAFVHDLEELVFEMELKAPLEGSIIFPNQKVVQVTAKAILIPFIKKLFSYYLPRQIAVATEVQKIVNFVSPSFVVTKNLEEYSPNYEHLYTKAAFVGGATACEDLFAASNYHIPLCFHGKDPSATFLDVNEEGFSQKVAMLLPNEEVFFTGGVTLGILEEYSFLLPNLKGVMVDFRKIDVNNVSLSFHDVKDEGILYRYSYKGLYCGDAYLDSKKDLSQKKSQRPNIGVKRKNLLVRYNGEIDPLTMVRKRAKDAIRSLPCKYNGSHPKEKYPIAVLN